MIPLSLILPLRIERLEEAVKVVDANGKAVVYAYICEERERRLQANRLSPEEGVEVARICARALTDAISALIKSD